jgi:hypothetical protein
VTQLGFLRIISNPSVLSEALSLSMVWRAYQSLLAGELVSFMEERDRATIDEVLAPITSLPHPSSVNPSTRLF